jgi:hypothetical protein
MEPLGRLGDLHVGEPLMCNRSSAAAIESGPRRYGDRDSSHDPATINGDIMSKSRAEGYASPRMRSIAWRAQERAREQESERASEGVSAGGWGGGGG